MDKIKEMIAKNKQKVSTLLNKQKEITKEPFPKSPANNQNIQTSIPLKFESNSETRKSTENELSQLKLEKRDQIESNQEEFKIDFEQLREKILKDESIKSLVSCNKNFTESEKLEWNFQNSISSIKNFEKRNKEFLDLYERDQDELKRYDYGINVHYREKCEDLMCFLVWQVNRFERDNPKTQKLNLKDDLVVFVDNLASYVSSLENPKRHCQMSF